MLLLNLLRHFLLWVRESRTVLCSDLSCPVLLFLLFVVRLVTLDESRTSWSLCVSGGWMPCWFCKNTLRKEIGEEILKCLWNTQTPQRKLNMNSRACASRKVSSKESKTLVLVHNYQPISHAGKSQPVPKHKTFQFFKVLLGCVILRQNHITINSSYFQNMIVYALDYNQGQGIILFGEYFSVHGIFYNYLNYDGTCQ